MMKRISWNLLSTPFHSKLVIPRVTSKSYSVTAAPMPGGSPGYSLAELQIYPGADLTVHLFTDHEERQLTWLAGAICKILGQEGGGEGRG